MSLCVQGARLASPFHFPKPCDGGRLMQDIVPDAGIGLHLASNTWYNTAFVLIKWTLTFCHLEFQQLLWIPGSTRRVLRRMWPRRGLAVPRSSSVPSLELLCRQETFLDSPNNVQKIYIFGRAALPVWNLDTLPLYPSSVPRISWQRGTRSLRCEKPRGSRLSALPRTRRKPPSRSLLLRFDLSILSYL